MGDFREPLGFMDASYLESLLSDRGICPPPTDQYDDQNQGKSQSQNHGRRQNSSRRENPFSLGFRRSDAPSVKTIQPDTAEILTNFELDERAYNNLERQIIDIFRTGGLLDKNTTFFKERQPQIEMVKSIITAVREKRNLVVEAGTGTGKTFAYLIPLLKLGRRVVVSTRTLNLQDQLLKRDIEHIKRILGSDYRVEALKGRANYVCLSRLNGLDSAKFRNTSAANEVTVKGDKYQFQSSILKIRNFLDRESSGDLSLLDFRDFEQSFIDKIAAHSHTCRGTRCKFYGTCYVNQARSRADDADLLIVNHSLLLQNYLRNFALFNSNPDVIVFDEGHHLPEVVRGTFTDESGSSAMRKCCSTLEEIARDRTMKGKVHDDQTFSNAIGIVREDLEFLLKDISKDLFFEMKKVSSEQFSSDKNPRFSVLLSEAKSGNPKITGVLRRLKEQLDYLHADFKSVISKFAVQDEKGNPLRSLIAAVDGFITDTAAQAESFIDDGEPSPSIVNLIVSTQNSFSLQSVPLDVSHIFPGKILDAGFPVRTGADASDDEDDPDDEDDINNEEDNVFSEKKISGEDGDDLSELSDDTGSSGNSSGAGPSFKKPVYVFTSATITSGNTFEKFCGWLGIKDELHLRVNSPFDYPNQGFIYLPDFIPQGKVVGEEHARQIVDYSLPLLKAIDGGFLILCTSNFVMSRVYNLLKNNQTLGKRRIYSQSLTSKVEIVRSMLRYGNVVTVATSSFWEGVDIPGDALSCVIIDRFPFKPMDTLQKSLSDYITRVLHGNSFMDLSLPEMIISLKQGVGRLIRSEDDFGVVAIADDRIVRGPSYGRKVLNELPPFAQTGSVTEIGRKWRLHRENIRNRQKQTEVAEEQEIEEILNSVDFEDKSLESWIDDIDE